MKIKQDIRSTNNAEKDKQKYELRWKEKIGLLAQTQI